MREYTAIKPTVYVETSVVSYFTSLPSRDSLVLSRQEATRQLLFEYSDSFEFIVSDIVITEIRQGDEKEAQLRLEAIADFTRLDMSPDAVLLAQFLVDAGAVPHSSPQDAQHIAIAAVENLDYLISWNFKHIVNEAKREHISRVCRAAGFQPTNVCTPVNLIEEIKMKEQPEPPTDPVLEEIYRMKAEFAAQFDSMEELIAHLKEVNAREKALGREYKPAQPPQPNFEERIEIAYKKLGIERKPKNKVSDE